MPNSPSSDWRIQPENVHAFDDKVVIDLNGRFLNSLLHDSAKTLSSLKEATDVELSLQDIWVDDHGRVVIENQAFKAAIEQKKQAYAVSGGPNFICINSGCVTI